MHKEYQDDRITRFAGFSNPLLLGFEELERVLDRATKTTNNGYPPYNIERIKNTENANEDTLKITLAVAGFTDKDLDVNVEENQLTIFGKQVDDKAREYLHHGIAARQFQRSFVLAEGMEVSGAHLANGLLEIDLVRIQPERIVRKISIQTKE